MKYTKKLAIGSLHAWYQASANNGQTHTFHKVSNLKAPPTAHERWASSRDHRLTIPSLLRLSTLLSTRPTRSNPPFDISNAIFPSFRLSLKLRYGQLCAFPSHPPTFDLPPETSPSTQIARNLQDHRPANVEFLAGFISRWESFCKVS